MHSWLHGVGKTLIPNVFGAVVLGEYFECSCLLLHSRTIKPFSRFNLSITPTNAPDDSSWTRSSSYRFGLFFVWNVECVWVCLRASAVCTGHVINRRLDYWRNVYASLINSQSYRMWYVYMCDELSARIEFQCQHLFHSLSAPASAFTCARIWSGEQMLENERTVSLLSDAADQRKNTHWRQRAVDTRYFIARINCLATINQKPLCLFASKTKRYFFIFSLLSPLKSISGGALTRCCLVEIDTHSYSGRNSHTCP